MKQQKHIPALDGLRGLAVLMVFVFHYGGGTHSSVRAVRLFGLINKGGWVGVTLFFVLSGFLITGILWDSFGQPHWWRNFYARRTLRIFPLYYLCILIVIAGAAFQGTLIGALGKIWVPALFMQNMPHLLTIVDKIPAPFGLFHFWSLAVEEQFYLIWPFLLAVQKSRRNAGIFCLLTFLFSFAFRILLWQFAPHPEQFNDFLFSRAGELAIGGWLALAWRGPAWERIERLAPVVTFCGLAGFIASGMFAGSFETNRVQMTVGLPCITICFTALLALCMRPGIVQRCAEARWLRWLGTISYGIYVYHMLFLGQYMFIVQKLLGRRSLMVTNAALLIVAAVGTLTIAWLSFNFFEKPFLRLKSRFPVRQIPPDKERTVA
ncbi:MAG: acyltransferase [Acidobacteria bacterium]|nr:acyltransferase [Acidobacteriota bacterium]